MATTNSPKFRMHAEHRVNERLAGITTSTQIMAIVASKVDVISKCTDWQAVVVIKRLNRTITVRTADGQESSGNVVVACVDPKNMDIKTVMLRHSWQLRKGFVV